MKIRFSILFLFLFSISYSQNIGLHVDDPQEDVHAKGSFRVDDSLNYTILQLSQSKRAFRTGLFSGDYLSNDSIGAYSFAAGYNTVANGFNSTAMGGFSRASGHYSSALGLYAKAEGQGATALGGDTRAVGYYSVASGLTTTTLGDYSFGHGWNNYIKGVGSTAFGLYNDIDGNTNFLAGWSNTSVGSYNTILGKNNTLTSESSFVAGDAISGGSYLTSYFGTYNDPYAGAKQDNWEPLDPLFVVGNGTQNVKNNAFVVMKDGKVGVDIKQPTEKLDVNGNIKTNGNFIGNGQYLTNLPSDGHWMVNSSHVFNPSLKVGIGIYGTDHKLAVNGNTGVYVNNTSTLSSAIGLELNMLGSGFTKTNVSARVGQLVNVKNAVGANIGTMGIVEGNDQTYNQTGLSGLARGLGKNKNGVTGYSTDAGDRNTGGYFEANGADINYGVIGIAEGNIGANIGVYGSGSGTIGYAGYFNGRVKTTNDVIVGNNLTVAKDLQVDDDIIVNDNLTVSGDIIVDTDVYVGNKLATDNLYVGPSPSSNFKAMQGGTFIVGADNTANDQDPATGTKVISVTFPDVFPSAPKLVITASAQTGATYNDAFSVTTRSVTTSGCILIVTRLDSNAYWSQNLKVDWFGFSM